jgi:C-terminal processing protease CtpA/Prc
MDFGSGGIPAAATDGEIFKLAAKVRPLATGEIEPARVVWAADSKSLIFQSKSAADPHLYSIAATGGAVKVLAEQRGVPIRVAGDGSLLWRVGQTPEVLGGERFPISTHIEQLREAELRLAFRRVWRTLGERFYDPSMNGSDWPGLLEKYEETAVAVRNSRQFDRVVSLLLGELNASHLSFLRKPWRGESRKFPKQEKTAHPGLVFRDGSTEGPLVIERVIRGSSVARLKDAPKRGETVVRIAGEPVTSHTSLQRFFNGAVDRALPVVIRAADGGERVIELRCISYASARTLDLGEREATARRRATQTAGISYLAVPNMSRGAFEELELMVYREALVSEGLILDFRNNGGGREADRMLALFSQVVHSTTVPRGGPEGYPHARRVHAAWNKPLVVLCNQNTFSNAEIFCHAMKVSGRAPLVGSATAGGVISAVKVTIPDAGVLQLPFRGWFQARTGENLDLNGAQPDFPVALGAADEHAGRDPQLAKAVEVLQKALAEGSPPVTPRVRR